MSRLTRSAPVSSCNYIDPALGACIIGEEPAQLSNLPPVRRIEQRQVVVA